MKQGGPNPKFHRDKGNPCMQRMGEDSNRAFVLARNLLDNKSGIGLGTYVHA